MPIQKYSRTHIILSPDTETAPAEVRDLFQKLDSYDMEMARIEKEVEAVDGSCLVLKKEIEDAADALASLGELTLPGSRYGGHIRVAVNIASALAKTYGSYISRRKSDETHRMAEHAKISLAAQKKETAIVKLPHILEVRDSLKESCSKQIEMLYERECNMTAALEDPLIKMRIILFTKELSLVVKSRFLLSALDYYVHVLDSWKHGTAISTKNRPSLEKELAKEISSWQRLLPTDTSMDSFLLSMVNSTVGSCPLPVAALLANPCLLRNYVGINIGVADNCPSAIIRLSPAKVLVKNPLVLGNNYYIHCMNILDNNYCPPKSVRGFGLIDILILLVVPVLFFGLTVLLSKLEHSLLWRFFLMLPIICWTALGIEYLDKHRYHIFPYFARVNSYNASYEAFRASVKKAENQAVFHIL